MLSLSSFHAILDKQTMVVNIIVTLFTVFTCSVFMEFVYMPVYCMTIKTNAKPGALQYLTRGYTVWTPNREIFHRCGENSTGVGKSSSKFCREGKKREILLKIPECYHFFNDHFLGELLFCMENYILLPWTKFSLKYKVFSI